MKKKGRRIILSLHFNHKFLVQMEKEEKTQLNRQKSSETGKKLMKKKEWKIF